MFQEEKIYEDLSPAKKRAGTVFKAILVLIFLTLSYYWKTQIIEYRKYWRMAENNRTRTRPITAPRGVIRDRNGEILADNRATFRILLFRENIKDAERSIAGISRIIGMSESELRARLERYKNVPAYEPIVIKDGLSLEEAAPVEGRKLEYPELQVDAEPQRIYPYGPMAAHVMGYLQERSEEELKADPNKKRLAGDLGGKSGIEKAYDEVLAGQSGSIVEVVDSLGRSRGELARTTPVPGRDIMLTLDAKLQALAESLLAGKEGAIVAIDTRTGEILTMASSPTFDPNKFITRFTPDEWRAVAGDPSSPMENRAMRGLYAPGSIFKVVMAMGGLDKGFIDASTAVFCSGGTVIYGVPFKCWFKPGHGLQRLPDAIRNSCNIYFYDLGRRMGINNIAETARKAGLGSLTGIDISGEKAGLVPDKAWKKKLKKEPWYPGETLPVSIGQGALQVTPLQLAGLMGLIANRGLAVHPHLLKSGTRQFKPGDDPAGEKRAFSPEIIEQVIEGMWRSVNDNGTGQGAKVGGRNVCGKTGSTQVMSRDALERLAAQGKTIKTHSWFCGFAPRVDPQIAVAVLVEFGGGGGAVAAPLAGRIFDQYFNPPVDKEEAK